MGAYKDTGYYKSVDGRICTYYKRLPDFRPLSEEALAEIDLMPIDKRERLARESGALVDLMQAQLNELHAIKDRAEKRPALRVLS